MGKYCEVASYFFQQHPVMVVVMVCSILLIAGMFYDAWKNNSEMDFEDWGDNGH